MPVTFIKIASSTVGAGGVSSITFSSIPSTYTDLVVKFSGNGSIINTALYMQFNGSSSSYTGRYLRGSGSAANSYTQVDFPSSVYGTYLSGSNTIPTNQEFYIPNYASSNFKSVSVDAVEERNGTTAYAMLTAGLWSNTAAITSITLSPDSGTILQYSTATLYGIKNS
jgi:hypothetical protein